METGTAEQIYHAPVHDYTRQLLSSFPSLTGERGDFVRGGPGTPVPGSRVKPGTTAVRTAPNPSSRRTPGSLHPRSRSSPGRRRSDGTQPVIPASAGIPAPEIPGQARDDGGPDGTQPVIPASAGIPAPEIPGQARDDGGPDGTQLVIPANAGIPARETTGPAPTTRAARERERAMTEHSLEVRDSSRTSACARPEALDAARGQSRLLHS